MGRVGEMGRMGEMGEIVCSNDFSRYSSVMAIVRSNDFSRYSSVMADAMTLPLLGLTTCLGTGAIACDGRDLADANSRGND